MGEWLVSLGSVVVIVLWVRWVTAPIRIARQLIREGWEPPKTDYPKAP